MICSYVASPLGDLLVVRREAGTDTAGGLAGLYFPTGRHRHRQPEATGTATTRPSATYVCSWTSTSRAVRREFDLPLDPAGTVFQRRVWSALVEIPYGETTTYGKLAAGLGAPTAYRAVGLANGQNPISIIVPCHRVVGANGSLTGYGGGLDAKRWLLTHETG